MPFVVFVTAFDRYALRAFDVHALDYLLKPFDRDRFRETLARAREQLERRSNGELERRLLELVQDLKPTPHPLERFVVKAGGRVFFVRADEIEWIEAAGNYVKLHVGTDSHLFRETMNAIEGEARSGSVLPHSPLAHRQHRARAGAAALVQRRIRRVPAERHPPHPQPRLPGEAPGSDRPPAVDPSGGVRLQPDLTVVRAQPAPLGPAKAGRHRNDPPDQSPIDRAATVGGRLPTSRHNQVTWSILLLVAALFASAASPAQGPLDTSVDAPKVLYVVSEAVTARADPDARSRAVFTLQPYDVVSGRQLVAGWLKVDEATVAGAAEPGWIPVSPDNLVTTTLEALKGRVFRVQQTKWPERIKMDVVRGRIRPGFTAIQVQLALGDPLRKSLRRSADDVAEEWTYADRRIVFSHTGVATIESLIPNP